MASSTDWARSIATTIVNHLREEEVASLRKYKVFAALEGSGNIRTNMSGRGFDWEIQYRNHTPSGNNGETPRSFARQNLWKNAELEYRGAQVTDAIYKKEMLENRSAQALVNVAGKMASRLLTSMEQYLAKEWVIDGASAGNELRFHGMESFLGYNGTINVSTGAQRAANPADPFAYPSDTYAGISTVLGAYGGSQKSGVWPNGEADPEFDFYSPVICNVSSSYFGAGGWAANADKALREALHQTRRNDTKQDQIDMCLLNRRWYIDFLNKLDAKERVVVGRTNGLRSYGFTDVFEFDGVEVSSENSVPADTGYGLAIGNMELLCMEGQLLTSEGPFYDEITQQYRYVVSTLGNLKFKSPRNFFKLAAIA
ncbi:MAG: hypothetical protein EBT15_10030 [Betaproteobacteria bacterium]|nr:hypothetical protein [Betaproteobacteria bacterium]